MSQIKETVCRLWRTLMMATSLINTGITLSVTINTNLLQWVLFSKCSQCFEQRHVFCSSTIAYQSRGLREKSDRWNRETGALYGE